jgi:hypothetical protein
MSSQAWLNSNLVCLHKAVLCANCEVISEGSNGHCAACGSEALLSLSRLLGGKIESDDFCTVASPAQGASDAVSTRYLSVAA